MSVWMKPLTRISVRSKTLSDVSDETAVNLIVGYGELIKFVNSLSLDWPYA